MGPKISVDSATMMNKGLERIEAAMLYPLPPERIAIVVHPESLVHSIVEYADGSSLAQLARPDMRVPIAHALAWPERWASGVDALDFDAPRSLHFEPADETRFPALRLAREALAAGGPMPAVLNAANEVAVEAFLAERISFTAISAIIEDSLHSAAAQRLPAGATLDEVMQIDKWSRQRAKSAIADRTRVTSHA
jgi:1-deoxy-D-xylulose-5-phosphate reductoisomerase